MKGYRVVITPFAADNIREAYAWFLAENPVYAAKWLDDIQSGVFGLENLPESRLVAPASDDFDCEIRHMIIGRGVPWRVFFTIDGETVYVLHVRHGSRDYWHP
ncbi:MAG: type II toxin-antitoxin system RelE/ParE family toxin [Magnetococcus sp. XQGC-1]